MALLPLLVGVLCHLTLCRTAYTLGLDSVKTLWADGQALKCGGVLSGGLAVGCEALVSKVESETPEEGEPDKTDAKEADKADERKSE